MAKPDASVIVRAKNEAAHIGATLDRLAAQTLGDHEVVVVDSGSADATAEIARARGARVVGIPAASFTFGGALNTGCGLASAPIAVALSAHAPPADDGWLERIVGACGEEGVACASGDSYGPDGGPLTGRLRQDAALAARRPQWGYSNAAGAFRMELWHERPFRADMPGAEDKEWAWWWLQRGWVHVAGADLVVEHDHTRDPVRDIYERSRREWEGYAMFLGPGDDRLLALAREWWGDLGTYTSPLKARLSHRRAARLLGAHAGRRRATG
jgi:rhamnosyltransferase